jgi:hypothetical protein
MRNNPLHVSATQVAILREVIKEKKELSDDTIIEVTEQTDRQTDLPCSNSQTKRIYWDVNNTGNQSTYLEKHIVFLIYVFIIAILYVLSVVVPIIASSCFSFVPPS